MSQPTRPIAKVRRISIRNYKGIENVELDLPGPRMKGDPDVMVIGSQNGLGKTSILECCSLLLSTLTEDLKQLHFQPVGSRARAWPIHLPDLLVRAGAKEFQVDGEISLGDQQFKIPCSLTKRGKWETPKEKLKQAQRALGEKREREGVGRELIGAISGMSADPVLTEFFLFFHSYRKVQEGNPDLGMMADADESYYESWVLRRRYNFSVSRFKTIILRLLMQKAKLFELSEEAGSSDTAIKKLNDLLEIYAGGTIISGLRPKGDNTVEFRIAPPIGDKIGPSFTFDGLSSGQKEIISTLFLIWYYTRERASVVLIDEPELHLNAQWHRSFVNTLFDLAPHNQYIVATHSADVMDSVEEDRRVLLEE